VHSVNQTTDAMVRSVLAYAENRLRMTPVPLDRGTRTPQPQASQPPSPARAVQEIGQAVRTLVETFPANEQR